MSAKYAVASLAIIGAISLAAPAFSQGAATGMDVAPGGGVYSRPDVSQEDPDRMSHPVVGEAKAPSAIAKGSEGDIEQRERAMTENLNQRQLRGTREQTADAPSE
jgi:hypothetical protein